MFKRKVYETFCKVPTATWYFYITEYNFYFFKRYKYFFERNGVVVGRQNKFSKTYRDAHQQLSYDKINWNFKL